MSTPLDYPGAPVGEYAPTPPPAATPPVVTTPPLTPEVITPRARTAIATAVRRYIERSAGRVTTGSSPMWRRGLAGLERRMATRLRLGAGLSPTRADELAAQLRDDVEHMVRGVVARLGRTLVDEMSADAARNLTPTLTRALEGER